MNRLMPIFSVFCLLTVPWLNPFTFGPTPAVVPWLFSMVCIGAVLGVRAISASGTNSQAWVRVVADAWLVAASMSALMGLLQYFGASTALAPWVNGTELGEAYGNLRQRNQFATLIAIGLVALAWRVTLGSSWRLAAVAATLLAFGSVASSSRTGLLQWLLLMGLVTQWAGQHQSALRRLMLVGGGAYVLASLALPWLAGLDPLNTGAWARLRTGDAACVGRVTLWSNVLHLIAQKPWLGWGWGELSYAHFTTVYPGARFCDILDNAHNLPLHLAVELGIPFSLAACGAGMWFVVWAKPWREPDPSRQMAWTVLAVIGLHSLLEYPLWYGPFQIACGASLWILWCVPSASNGAAMKSGVRREAVAAWMAPLAVAVLASCAYAAWDYWRVSQLYLPVEERSSVYKDHTLSKLRGSWLFQNQVWFAELTTSPVFAENAVSIHYIALRLLHFSPEPRVVEKLVESAQILGLDEEAAYYTQRYRLAFPDAHAQWALHSARHKTP